MFGTVAADKLNTVRPLTATDAKFSAASTEKRLNTESTEILCVEGFEAQRAQSRH